MKTPPPVSKENSYECAHCHGVFDKGWSDEESEKEAELVFGKPVKDWESEPVLVCDDCYKLMLPSENADKVSKAKKEI